MRLAVDDSRTNVPRYFVRVRRTVALHEVVYPQHPQHLLLPPQAREHMVGEVRGRHQHTSRVTRWVHAPNFARTGHEVVVTGVISPGPNRAVGRDAAFAVLIKGSADKLPASQAYAYMLWK